MARPTQDPQIRINEILDAADKLFFTKGYQATTISDITKKMGVAQGMLYYYFKSKEDILRNLLERYANSLLSEILAIEKTTTNPITKIELILNTTLTYARHKEGLLLALLYAEQNLTIKENLFRQLQLSLTPCLAKVVESGVQEEIFSVLHPLTAVDYLLVIVDFLCEALYEKTSPEILVYRIQMAEMLIERILGLPNKSLNIATIN